MTCSFEQNVIQWFSPYHSHCDPNAFFQELNHDDKMFSVMLPKTYTYYQVH